MSGSEQLVGKLHGALAVFRKERDDLYRSKELAQERLRLIVEERQAMEKAVNAMQIKLNELNCKIQGNDESKDLATLQSEVERLDQEVRKSATRSRRRVKVKKSINQFLMSPSFQTRATTLCRQDFSMQNW